jgi:hypothetical protein
VYTEHHFRRRIGRLVSTLQGVGRQGNQVHTPISDFGWKAIQ